MSIVLFFKDGAERAGGGTQHATGEAGPAETSAPVDHKDDLTFEDLQKIRHAPWCWCSKCQPDLISIEPVSTIPGLSTVASAGAQCEGEGPVGMMLQENCKYPYVAGSETPTGNTFLESVRNATITCQECGVRAQMRCSCGVLVCLRHVYDIDGDPYCSTCVVNIRVERNIQDDLTLEMYKNIARRR